MPNAKLVATSLVLMRFGVEEVVRQAFAALKAFDAHVVRDKVSRVDLCCDLPDRTIEPLNANHSCGNQSQRKYWPAAAAPNSPRQREAPQPEASQAHHERRSRTTAKDLGPIVWRRRVDRFDVQRSALGSDHGRTARPLNLGADRGLG